MGELSLFYLLHTKITMNIFEMAVQINGVWINEGPLYSELRLVQVCAEALRERGRRHLCLGIK